MLIEGVSILINNDSIQFRRYLTFIVPKYHQQLKQILNKG